MDKIRWGILGTGRIAQQFAQDLAHVANGTLAAIASRSSQTACEFARKYDVPRAHGSYMALFEDAGVDAVYIATPHTLHEQNASDALRLGKAVLCEKPLTTSIGACDSMIASARNARTYLVEGMWTYFLPAILQAQRWVADGRIGCIRHIKADFGYPLLPYDPARREYAAELAGGALFELGIYPIALAWLFLGRDPVRVSTIGHYAANGVENDVLALFDYDGCVATLGASFRCKLQNWAYIIGEQGYIAIPDFWRARECRLYRLDECIDRFEDGRHSLGFAYEASAVGEEILNGKSQSAIVPWDSSRRFQQHIQQVRAALAGTA